MRGEEPITRIKGIGPKTAEAFGRLGVFTVEDLIRFLPRSFFRLPEPVPVMRAGECDLCAVSGIVTSPVNVITVKGMAISSTTLTDEAGEGITLKWFRAPWIRQTVHMGDRLVCRGRVSRTGKKLSLVQPQIFTPEKYAAQMGQLRPVYPLTAGLTQAAVEKAVAAAFEGGVTVPETLSEEVRRAYGLMEAGETFKTLHFPPDEEKLRVARERCVFEEFFRFLQQMKRLKGAREAGNVYALTRQMATDELIARLPFALTGAQRRVLEEIRTDLCGRYRMNRLVQGDVGSGKTILAFLALYETVQCGYQGVLMAPTEVLARQHAEGLMKLNDSLGLGLRVVLLTGSVTGVARREAYEQIRTHGADIVVGTHALIQEKVEYACLALAVTDEQHRFGVKQREALQEKGLAPHVLVMSATPIPRTLAMILYGDFDVSVLDEKPADRLRIRTAVVDASWRPKAWHFIRKECLDGHQAYVICPLVEESELSDGENVGDYAEKLQAAFGDRVRVGLLHGRMSPEEKAAVMDAFAAHRTDVLVSTTVIEVGIDVANATVIVIENADRFGLAQLHQLRGRVGRGDAQSYCILVNTSGKEEAADRLNVLRDSADGFVIAEEDMKRRGPGDLFGIRQSGAMEFSMADIYQDSGILMKASEACDRFPDGLLDAGVDLRRPTL